MSHLFAVCSHCGKEVHRSEAHDPASKHTRVECGTLDTLLEEIQTLARLKPERMEAALRYFIRAYEIEEKL